MPRGNMALRMQRRFAGMGRQLLRDVVSKEIDAIKAAGTFKNERVITSPQAGSVTTAATSGPVLNFCGNNYLGLSNHPEVKAAAIQAIEERGFGMGSVRFICGTQDLHVKLEEKVTSFLGTEGTILYPSCFDANAGVFEALLTADDAVISDSLNHASIIDGIRLCKAERHRYNHNDMTHLENILKETQHKRVRMIVTDGVFSMDGDIAPLPEITDLAHKYDACVFIDDCHATGVIGPGGKGSSHYFGVSHKIDIINSTLGKAMGGASGGFSSGCKEFVDLQRQRARPYLFSNAIAPMVVAGTYKAFEVLEQDTSVLEQLKKNTTQFRSQMKAAGFTISGSDECAIAPVMLGDAKLASDFAEKMLAQGIYVIGFSFPVVPKGQARIRVQLSASHSTEQVQTLINAFISVKQEMGL
eukprot:TRINITY_DN18540_c0_g1_i2.p1 TRINITY_DN18540_c0_g1~~TRINITY_DN18540_c0_g1_i2.p1  ORF type:complete len:414 (+),score=204.90 TRINITY_DN18540_c0_g1_i2:998-2239(+)